MQETGPWCFLQWVCVSTPSPLDSTLFTNTALPPRHVCSLPFSTRQSKGQGQQPQMRPGRSRQISVPPLMRSPLGTHPAHQRHTAFLQLCGVQAGWHARSSGVCSCEMNLTLGTATRQAPKRATHARRITARPDQQVGGSLGAGCCWLLRSSRGALVAVQASLACACARLVLGPTCARLCSRAAALSAVVALVSVGRGRQCAMGSAGRAQVFHRGCGKGSSSRGAAWVC